MKPNKNNYPTLDISKLSKFANGKNRDIYLVSHPAPDTDGTERICVLKVLRSKANQERELSSKMVLKSLFPASRQRVILKEVKYLEKLLRRGAIQGFQPPIPAFRGFVNTAKGRGTLWETMLDRSGNLAPSIKELGQAGKLADAVEPLNRFVKICFDHNIVAPDINENNLTLTYRNDQSEVVLVDGFGDHRLISLRSIWPALNARSLADRFDRLGRRTGLQFDRGVGRFLPVS